ncbi:outer membrane protein assembly factor BamB family protein [Kitasatospora sp. NPDC004240]
MGSERAGGEVSPEESGASWEWDGPTADGPSDGVAGDVVSGAGERSSFGRRRLLLAGGGALLAGAAAWAFGRPDADGPAPVPRPLPTRLSGPAPVWTYRGGAPMSVERLTSRPVLPVYPSRDELLTLDPATGTPRRRMEVPAERGGSGSPYEQLVIGPDRLFTTSNGHVDSRHLTEPAADWSLPLPEELGERGIWLQGCDATTLYGFTVVDAGRMFALDTQERKLRWVLPADDALQLLPPAAALPDGRVVARTMTGGTVRLTLLDRAGNRVWSVPADEQLKWHVPGPEHLHVPEGPSGLRAVRGSDGTTAWRLAPRPPEEWRCLPPLADGPRVYVPRDNGLVTAHAADTGAELWSHRFPFRLDSRSRLLLGGSLLLVPGPAAEGVCALDAATGAERWTFRDSAPGVGVWTLSSGPEHLYAGHDDTLHALPLS